MEKVSVAGCFRQSDERFFVLVDHHQSANNICRKRSEIPSQGFPRVLLLIVGKSHHRERHRYEILSNFF